MKGRIVTGAAPPVAPHRDHLLGRLAVVEARVAAAVEHRRRGDPNPDDRFRGLYVSEAHVARLLDVPEPTPDDPAAFLLLQTVENDANRAAVDGHESRLRVLSGSAGLGPAEIDLLLVALAPELDPRFEKFYGYLNDDVSSRRATVGLALALTGLCCTSHDDRALLAPGRALVDHDLLAVEGDGPLLSRALRVPDRVVAHLLGDDRPDARLAPLLLPRLIPLGDGHPVRDAWATGADLVYLDEPAGTSARGTATAAAVATGRPCLHIDVRPAAAAPDLTGLLRAAGREAVLARACLTVGPLDALGDSIPAALAGLSGIRTPTVVYGRGQWDPRWTSRSALVATCPALTDADRAAGWAIALGRPEVDPVLGGELAALRLPAEDLARAVDAASVQARLTGTSVEIEHLRAGAREQNGAGLSRLSRRIAPRAGWADLVLPDETRETLVDLADRTFHRGTVLGTWRMSRRAEEGSIVGLFVGPSGTGKTLAAEVIAGHLGVDLYMIDLARVVDKYIGETEKNLDRIFAEADQVNGVLLFDEADALFGKRSEVRDAHDRYANIEVAYLLQRLESFGGTALLTSNLRTNIDDAFARRIDAIVEFAEPDADLRRRLWETCLGPTAPRDADLDLDFCAQSLEVAGGNIRSIVTSAAYAAARAGRPIAMADVMRAAQREYRKLGRLCVAAEFGSYLDLPT